MAPNNDPATADGELIIAATDPAEETIAEFLESVFTVHNVTAFLMETSYSNSPHVYDSAKWGVKCDDCGRAEDFHIVPKEGKARVSSVFVESLEDRPCDPYELPNDVNTGAHRLVIGDEKAGETGRDRDVHCADCGRTTIATAKPEYVGKYIDRLGEFPCAGTYTDEELAGSILYPSIAPYPNPDEVGIDNWQYEGGRGWGQKVDGFWQHSDVAVTVILKSRRGNRWVEFQLGGGTPTLRSPSAYKIVYETDSTEGEDYEAVTEALAFMQATNAMEGDDWQDFAHSTAEPVKTAIEEHTLSRGV